MLLPSSLPCDASQASPAPASPTFISRNPPGDIPSPPDTPQVASSHNALGNIMNTCRSLQSLLSMASPSCDYPAPALTLAPLMPPQLTTPPSMHVPAPSPMRLRLRRRDESPSPGARRRIAKRITPRGPAKRRRVADDDDAARQDSDPEFLALDLDSDVEFEQPQQQHFAQGPLPPCPSTPKRSRIAPRHLPLGLERSDFHALDILQGSSGSSSSEHDNRPGTGLVTEADGSEWSVEDDRVLIELVIEKLRLSKEEWLDCAKSLGKDRHVVSRRWRSLVASGDVGLKRGGRPSLYSTWR